MNWKLFSVFVWTVSFVFDVIKASQGRKIDNLSAIITGFGAMIMSWSIYAP